MKRFTLSSISLIIALALSVSLSSSADTKASAKPAQAAAPVAKKEPIDINTASEAQLKAIPDIGDAYAKKIIAGRPYAKKEAFMFKGVLPKATYEKIKDLVVVKKK